MTKRFTIYLISCILGCLTVSARDMKELLSSPDSVLESIFLGQSRNARLDMLDYHEAGLETFVKDSSTGSQLRIADLSDNHVRIATNTPVTYDFYAYSAGKDSLSVAIVSLPVGAGDCQVVVENIYTGQKIQDIAPDYTDWVKTSGVDLNTLQAAVPYITVSASFDPDTGCITLVNNSVDTPGLDPVVAEALIPTKVLRWNGKKFIVEK